MDEVITVTLDSAGTQTVHIKLTCNLETDGDYACMNYVVIDNGLLNLCGLSDKIFDLRITVYDKTWTVEFSSDSTVSYARGFRLDYYIE